jgi:cytochrome c peroxidase
MDIGLEVGPRPARRVELGGRPLTVAFADEGRTAVVANSLRDAVQVVDVPAGKLLRTIPLGAPPGEPSLARQGEALFYDAKRSHHQWFSCHTCHTEGHTSGQLFDTLNDESYGNPKLTPTLHNVTKTAPYTWHGWQKELTAAVEKSLTDTMFGAKPQPGDVPAMIAYLDTLTPAPNPHRPDGVRSEAAERGKVIFESKARCARCHKGELYTSDTNYDLKLGYDGSPFDLWNPPSLLGVWDRGPFMHDGRAETLEQLIEKQHVPEKLGGQALTAEERRDLVAFLKSL